MSRKLGHQTPHVVNLRDVSTARDRGQAIHDELGLDPEPQPGWGVAAFVGFASLMFCLLATLGAAQVVIYLARNGKAAAGLGVVFAGLYFGQWLWSKGRRP
jgi:hypothetical protein